ncbi:hypothetical protein ACFU5O_20610 [Streptomyces sp. NPDC057445]|uniref:hypothetical protein n=1 Tax=Streptomyces sp. NPDC057445 TaxID=3346136 RepID=UPI0036B2CA5C
MTALRCSGLLEVASRKGKRGSTVGRNSSPGFLLAEPPVHLFGGSGGNPYRSARSVNSVGRREVFPRNKEKTMTRNVHINDNARPKRRRFRLATVLASAAVIGGGVLFPATAMAAPKPAAPVVSLAGHHTGIQAGTGGQGGDGFFGGTGGRGGDGIFNGVGGRGGDGFFGGTGGRGGDGIFSGLGGRGGDGFFGGIGGRGGNGFFGGTGGQGGNGFFGGTGGQGGNGFF